MAKTSKKVYIAGVSPCYQDIAKKQILELFTDKKNRIDAVFAKKEDSPLLIWIREQISAEKKSLVLENNGNITRLNNAQIFYDGKVKFIEDYVKDNLGKKNILILANGDPNFFGIGGAILSGLKENEKRFIEIYPAISYMQVGFSKLKIPMTHAYILSLHGRNFEDLHPVINTEKIIGIYTDEINTPDKIYGELEEKGIIEKFDFYVLTELCSKNEKIYKSFTKEILEDISGKKNIVILKEKNQKNKTETPKAGNHAYNKRRNNDNYDNNVNCAEKTGNAEDTVNININNINRNIVLGIEDDKYIHASGEPTKKEIRAVSLGMMEIKEDSVIIDAGCGSGSVSIEAAGLAFRGKVYSIDKNKQKIENLKRNMKKFGRNNIEPILGELPDALKNSLNLKLKGVNADSVFIGGGGAENIDGILKESLNILKENGVIAVNAVTVETLYAVINFIKNAGLKYEMVSLNVSRLKSIGETSYFQALNQIYVIKIVKKFLNQNALIKAGTKTETKTEPKIYERPKPEPHPPAKKEPKAEHKTELKPETETAGKKRNMTFKIENTGDKKNEELNSKMPKIKVRNKAIVSPKSDKDDGGSGNNGGNSANDLKRGIENGGSGENER
ncbi:MAG: precorrin-6y C5,15-methyltransferase (decarboxylating) subunit CbiE [Candidatus Acidulodesulfobacterium sp.]